jgi:hypothetical protein
MLTVPSPFTVTTTSLDGAAAPGPDSGCGTSALSPREVVGVMTMKMMINTSRTSIMGVTLMAARWPREPSDIAICWSSLIGHCARRIVPGGKLGGRQMADDRFVGEAVRGVGAIDQKIGGPASGAVAELAVPGGIAVSASLTR